VRGAFVDKLSELAGQNPRIMLITGDLGFGVLDGFAAAYPRQYLNVGVAEQNMMGVAAGLALEGRVVFTYSIANFATLRCLEQIRNDVCYHGANVKIVAIGGGFSYGALGISHHATEDLGILRALPDMTVVAPADRWEAAEATDRIARAAGTCYLRLDRAGDELPSDSRGEFSLGTARRIREGTDLTLIGTGGLVPVAVAASDRLRKDGIGCRVLSMHTVKPLDADAVRRACVETGGIVTLEEHGLDCGLGSAVAEACLDQQVAPLRFRRMALRSGFSSTVGSQTYLRSLYGLDEAHVVETVRSVLSGDRS
jgi:transketolase